MSKSGYPIPKGPFRIEKKISKSRFIASCDHVTSTGEAKAFHDRIRQEFSNATHNCFAFVAGPAGSSIDNGMSDDGEPKGTAGRPMLSTLVHSGVGEIAVVVTRYYGGVKLGTGGLVKAYSGMVADLLEQLPVKQKITGPTLSLTFDYKDIEIVKNALRKSGGELLSESFTETVLFHVLIPDGAEEDFKGILPYEVVVRDVAQGAE